MEYALHNGLRTAAQPGLKGTCEHCGGAVQAKCGSIMLWHWAHVNLENCDSWHEPETLWHREWKTHFGKECSEISIIKEGVKHIADVLTKNNVVIEFQNSPITPETIIARENFYNKMIWVINGTKFRGNFLFEDKDFIENWEVKTQLKTFTSTFPKDESAVLIVNIRHVKHEGVREIIEQLNFVYHAREEIYSYYLKSSNDGLALKNKIQERVFDLYRKNKISYHFKLVTYLWNRPKKSWKYAEKPVFIDLGADGLIWITSNIGYKEGEGKLVSKKQFLEKYNPTI